MRPTLLAQVKSPPAGNGPHVERIPVQFFRIEIILIIVWGLPILALAVQILGALILDPINLEHNRKVEALRQAASDPMSFDDPRLSGTFRAMVNNMAQSQSLLPLHREALPRELPVLIPWAGAGLVMWYLWTRIRPLGYWMVFGALIAACIGLLVLFVLLVLVAGASLFGPGRSGTLSAGPLAVAAIGLALQAAVLYAFVWRNVVCPDVKRFFNHLNGACPVCGKGVLGCPVKRLVWTCPSCGMSVKWMPYNPRKRLRVKCPQCAKSLKGATEAMIGDTGVCKNCRAEFPIRRT